MGRVIHESTRSSVEFRFSQRAGVKTVVGEKVLRAALYRDGEHLPAYGVGGGGGIVVPAALRPGYISEKLSRTTSINP